jgi:hypothetical protein
MLIILCAHKIEAQPFIQHYGLGQVANLGGLTVFGNPRIQLLLTGQGVQNAQKSFSRFLLKFPPQDTEYYLNFGVTGSSQFNTGTLLTIDRVIDPAANKAAVIDTEDGIALPHCPCHTVSKVECEYAQNGVYDMEAAALCDELQRHNLLDRLRVIKLVSDGPDHPADRLGKAAIRHLVTEKASQVCCISDKLLNNLCNK